MCYQGLRNYENKRLVDINKRAQLDFLLNPQLSFPSCQSQCFSHVYYKKGWETTKF